MNMNTQQSKSYREVISGDFDDCNCINCYYDVNSVFSSGENSGLNDMTFKTVMEEKFDHYENIL